MRKLIVVLVAVAVSFGMFSVMTEKEVMAGDVVELDILHRWPPEAETYGKFLAQIFERFDAMHDDIVVNVNPIPASMYEAQLTVRLASDDAPDVFCLWPGGRTESQVRNGAVLDLTDMWKENGWFEAFTPGVVAGNTHQDGKMYTLPVANMTNTFWYNTHIFEEVGVTPPNTWDELMDAAAKIKAAGYIPFALGGNPTRWMPAFWFDYLLLNIAGGEFRERLMWGKESWESEEVYRVFETWKDAIDKGYFNQDFASVDAKQATALMASKKAAMMLQGPWAINQFLDLGWAPEEDFNLFPFPQVDENVEQASQGAMEAWCINANGAEIEAAKKLLAFMGSPEISAESAKFKNVLGPRKDTGFEIFSDDTRGMQKRIAEETGDKPLHMNFELATLPEMQNAGMDAIIEFMAFPDNYKSICSRLEAVSKEVFGE